jgi:hypothetical protein
VSFTLSVANKLIMLNVVMPTVVMPTVVMPTVVMTTVVMPSVVSYLLSTRRSIVLNPFSKGFLPHTL